MLTHLQNKSNGSRCFMASCVLPVRPVAHKPMARPNLTSREESTTKKLEGLVLSSRLDLTDLVSEVKEPNCSNADGHNFAVREIQI